MKRIFAFCLLVAVCAAGNSAPTRAQSFADASLALERAVHAELVSGDIEQAISLYREVAESVAASREDVSKALVALGRSYEMIGSGEAVAVYQRLVSEFPDQPEAFMTGHKALERLEAALPVGERSAVARQDYTLMVGDLPGGVAWGPGRYGRGYEVSPDGSTVVVSVRTQPYRRELHPRLERELYFLEPGGTVLRPVLDDPGEWVEIDTPRWSPDGKYLFFEGTMRSEGARSRGYSIYDLDGARSVHVVKDLRVYPVLRFAWMPDSRRFVTVTPDGSRVQLVELDGTVARQYDLAGRSIRLGSVSPDGRYLAFQRHQGGPLLKFDIWLLDLVTGEQTQITAGGGTEGPATWSRDGRSIYYTVDGWPEVTWRGNLYKTEIATGAFPERITHYTNTAVLHPVVVPETGALTFALVSSRSTVLTAPADAPGRGRELIRGWSPGFGPDGEAILFQRAPPESGLWMSSLTGGDPHQLAPNGEFGYRSEESLSPNGNRVAYSVREGDETVLYTMSVDGGPPTRLYSHAGEQPLMVPKWSPDGSEIVFGADDALMVTSAEGGRVEVLATDPENWGGWGDVSWSPDGRLIAGFVYTDEYTILYLVDRRNKALRRLTPPEESGYKEGLSWHPDGDRLTYVSNSVGGTRTHTRVVTLTGRRNILTDLIDGRAWVGRWGPDRRYYYLLDTGNRGHDLYVFDEKAQTVTPFIHAGEGRALYQLPSWSPDGSMITWAEETKIQQLWMLTDYK